MIITGCFVIVWAIVNILLIDWLVSRQIRSNPMNIKARHEVVFNVAGVVIGSQVAISVIVSLLQG
jgi:uncharacterized membrane protein